MIHPVLILKIPLHGFLDTLFKLERWLPTQFLLQLSRVDGVTHIMTLSVSYISNEIHILAFLSAEQSVNGLDYHLDDIDILPLVETADVVSLGNLSLVENHIDIIKVVIKTVDRLLGRPEGADLDLITYVTDRKGHDMRYAIDSRKLQKELGWEPSLQFEEGIEETVKWYLDNQEWMDNVTSGDYQKYYENMYKDR